MSILTVYIAPELKFEVQRQVKEKGYSSVSHYMQTLIKQDLEQKIAPTLPHEMLNVASVLSHPTAALVLLKNVMETVILLRFLANQEKEGIIEEAEKQAQTLLKQLRQKLESTA